MKKALFLAGVVLAGCICTGSCQAADDQEKQKESRFVLYQMIVDEKPKIFLLDSQTGKVWLHYKKQGPTGDQDIFRGVTVEGVAYTSGEAKALDQQIEEWHLKDFVDKEIKGFRETMESDYLYKMDLRKAKELDYELELLKRAEEKK